MSWAPPDEVAEFRIVRPLGRGAMGEVFLAHDTQLDRKVAIKFVGGAEVSDVVRDRFYNEARAVARLAHPNVVHVYRVGELRRRPYLVSEYVDGVSLDRIPRPLPYERVLAIGAGLAAGLAAAHDRGILHRDIKPANAIVTPDGHAKLLDFGVAKLLEHAAPVGGPPRGLSAERDVDATLSLPHATVPATPPGTATMPGTIVGTPLYLAPEVWRGAPASLRSDIYALGTVLFELITGHAPHAGVPIDALGARASEVDAPRLANVPARFADLVGRCLAIEPSARFDSAGALLTELTALGAAARFTGAPYRGLLAFEAAQRDVFFGRDRTVEVIVERLRAKRFVVVAGDSGIGKSSLVRAGVVPRLCDELPALYVALCVPGATPHVEVPAGPTLVVVDQLEELVTLAQPEAAEAFARRLVAAVAERADVSVIATSRVDFLGRLASLDAFTDLLSHLVELVGPLSDRGLREAVTAPARLAGYEVEPSIVDELVAAGRESLPVLQFALAELWELRDDERNRLTRAALRELGGVGGALARHADRLLAALGEARRELAWHAIVRMITDDGTRAVVARRDLDDLTGDPSIVEALIRGRLFVEREEHVEVAHEALFTRWPALAAWRGAHDQDARFRSHLSEAAQRWEERGRPRGLLWRDDALAEYRARTQRWSEPQTQLELAFGGASLAELRRARRVRTGVIAAMMTVLAAAALFLLRAERRASHARDEAESQRLTLLVSQARSELAVGHAQRALPYFVEALRGRLDTPALRFGIAEAMRAFDRDRDVMIHLSEGVTGLAAAPDGSVIVAIGLRGRLVAFGRDRKPRMVADAKVEILDPQLCADHRTLLAVGHESLFIWDLATGALRRMPLPPDELDEVGALACAPDAREAVVGGQDGIARIVDLAAGRARFELRPDGTEVSCVALSRDGAHAIAGTVGGTLAVYAIADGALVARSKHPVVGRVPCRLTTGADGAIYETHHTSLYEWLDLATAPRAIIAHTKGIESLELSPDSARVLTGSADGTARIWRAGSLEPIGEVAPRAEVRAAHFDTIGARIVTVTGDNLFRVWDAASRIEQFAVEAPVTAGAGHRAGGAFYAWLDGGTNVLIAGSGVDLHAWSATPEPLLRHAPMPSPGGVVVRWSPREDAMIWADGKLARVVRGARAVVLDPGTSVWDGAWSPDGTRVVLVGSDGLVAVYDATTGAQLMRLRHHAGAVNRTGFSPDGARLVTAGSDHRVGVWNAATGALERDLTLAGPALSAAWSRDGASLATADFLGNVQIWDARTWTQVWSASEPTAQFLHAALSPDATRIAAGGHDGIVTIWTPATGEKRKLLGHTGPCTTVAWSPDGALLASGAEAGGVRIWDVASGQEIGRRGDGAGRLDVAWSRDGARILATGDGADVFSVARDRHTLAELDAIVAARDPWQLVYGQLMPR